MQFLLSTKVVGCENDQLKIEGPNGASFLKADAILVSIGRRPNTKNLGLEPLGIQTDNKGFIQINQSFQTAVPSIFAIGDIVDGPMLAHKASEEGIVVAELIAKRRPHINTFFHS